MILLRAKKEAKAKALKLTSDFEGFRGYPTGNFDGQLLSWGPLQWNVGQGTLQSLLRSIRGKDPESFELIMGDDFSSALDSDDSFEAFVRGVILNRDHDSIVNMGWRDRFVALSKTGAAQEAFVAASEPYQERGRRLCEALGFKTERGYALCFDIAVQNGAPRNDHINTFKAYVKAAKRPLAEWEQLKMLAKVVAALANPRWYDDVLSRKLTIAVGAGVVHGKEYDLDDYGISYEETWFESEPPCGITRFFLDGVELRVRKATQVGNKLYIATKK